MERTPEVPASIRDEALARHGVSREVPCSALTPSFWNAESVILELKEQENSHKAHFSGFL